MRGSRSGKDQDGSAGRFRAARNLPLGCRARSATAAPQLSPRHAGRHFPESDGGVKVAVYKRTYSAYEGSITPGWSRFLILPRYSFARLWQSKFLVMFFMACFFYPLGCVGYIYLANNLSILSSFGIPRPLGQ